MGQFRGRYRIRYRTERVDRQPRRPQADRPLFAFTTPFAKIHPEHRGAFEVDKVKCPNCGFVTFPDPAECKKCGQRFAPAAPRPQPTARSVTFRSPDRQYTLSSREEPSPLKLSPAPAEAKPVAEQAADALSVGPQTETGTETGADENDPRQRGAAGQGVAAAAAGTPWHEEIAERVARYRRRRGIKDETEDSRSNFEFDFDTPLGRGGPGEIADGMTAAETELRRRDLHAEFDLDLDGGVDEEPPNLDAMALEPEVASGRHEDPEEWALEPLDFRPADRPVEIVLHSGASGEDAGERDDSAPQAAPLGRRFAAGMLDGVVLLIAGAAFFLLFRASGGLLDRQPVNLAVVAIAAAFLVVFYFSVFTALAFATPGQSAVGLGVRTFDGERPDVRASLWRGAGYIVSAASLMLGFAWAVLDPERLTWHDRMSGTCLVERR